MNFIDIHTVIIIQFVTDAICTAVLAFLWVQNRKRFAGLSYWLLDYGLQTLAVLLIACQANLPDWLLIGFTNIFVIVATLVGYLGLLRFLEIKRWQIHNYLLLIVLIAVQYYFAFVNPNLEARNFNISVGLFLICLQCMLLMLISAGRRFRRIEFWVGLVFGFFCLSNIFRIIVVSINPLSSNEYFLSGAYNPLLMLLNQTLHILLAFGLLMLVNQRLISDIQTQEEKYAKAFLSSPYAMSLTRLADGKILEVNAGFVNLTGYSSEELIGKTTLDLHFWVNESDRKSVINDLSKGNRVVEKEFLFRIKSGEVITGIFSSEMIKIGDEPWILSSLYDITARKRAEGIQEAVYKISNSTISTHRIEDFYQSIQKILSDIISVENFYIALYDPIKNQLSFPYFIDQHDELPTPYEVGRGLTEYVLRTRKPLLASPEKFATLVAQGEVDQVGAPSIDWLGVPLIVDEQIIGVMVTQSYTEGVRFDDVDAALLAFVAAQVALAIENKRVEQKIHYLGNHDSMTELYNRAFFDEEMTRLEHSRRFPISIVMADVDNLKEINDELGHADGDELLRQVARVLKASFRSDDVIARIGGDEFAVLLPATDLPETMDVIKRIHDNIHNHNAIYPDPPISLSIGSSTAESGGSLIDAFIKADKDMYRDKNSKE